MDSGGGGAVLIENLTREPSLQHHLRAIWEDEVIEEARGVGCLSSSNAARGMRFRGGAVGSWGA